MVCYTGPPKEAVIGNCFEKGRHFQKNSLQVIGWTICLSHPTLLYYLNEQSWSSPTPIPRLATSSSSRGDDWFSLTFFGHKLINWNLTRWIFVLYVIPRFLMWSCGIPITKLLYKVILKPAQQRNTLIQANQLMILLQHDK